MTDATAPDRPDLATQVRHLEERVTVLQGVLIVLLEANAHQLVGGLAWARDMIERMVKASA